MKNRLTIISPALMTGIDMAQFNAFEEAIDFSFWKELCEKHGELHHYRRGEYFAYTGEAVKRVVWMVYSVGRKPLDLFSMILSLPITSA